MKHKSTLLNKSEASHYLHSLHDEAIEELGIENDDPNFHSLICENLRAPITTGALKKGRLNGNRAMFGEIEYLRIGNKLMFVESLLRRWFVMHYFPLLFSKTRMAA